MYQDNRQCVVNEYKMKILLCEIVHCPLFVSFALNCGKMNEKKKTNKNATHVHCTHSALTCNNVWYIGCECEYMENVIGIRSTVIGIYSTWDQFRIRNLYTFSIWPLRWEIQNANVNCCLNDMDLVWKI